MHPPNCVLNCQGASLQRKWFYLFLMNISDVIALWQFNILPDSPLNKHNPTFSIVFYSTAAASSFLHNHVKFYLSPKFLNKDCDRHQRGMAAFALKLMWLFVMAASLVVLPLPSNKAWNANSGKTVL